MQILNLTPIFSRTILLAFFAIFFLSSVLSGYLTGYIGVDNIYDLKRMLVIFFIVFSSGCILFRSSFLVSIPSCFTLLVVISLFIVGFISTFFSQHPFWSLLELANFLLLICLFYTLGVLITDIGRKEALKYLFWFALFFLICISLKFFLLLIFHALDANRPDIHSLISGFMNARFFNQLQVILMPLLSLSLYIKALKKYSKLAMSTFSVQWLILLQSEARGALFAIIVATFVVYVFLPVDMRKVFIRSIVKAAILGSFLWLLLIIIVPLFIFDSHTWQLRTDSSGRIAMWVYILQVIPERIFFGFGPMSFAWAEGKPLLNAHPHNALLQFLYEFGVFAFILVTSWSAVQLLKILKTLSSLKEESPKFKKQSDIESTNIVIAYALCSAWIYAMFDGVIVMPLSQALLAAVLAFNSNRHKTLIIGLRLPWKIVLIAILLSSAVMLLGSVNNLTLGLQHYPRLWMMGVISN